MVQKKRQAKAQSKISSASKKKQKHGESQLSEDVTSQIGRNEEESKVEEEATSNIDAEEDQQMNQIINKFGFKDSVILDMTLPSGEREVITDFQMQFLNRNYQFAMNMGLENDTEAGQDNPFFQRAKNIFEANADYECTLADVVNFLKKCGYPLENCFLAFFSPVFSAYINCGLDPLPNSIKITKEDLTIVTNPDNSQSYRLLLKSQWGIRSEYKAEEEPFEQTQEIMTQSGRQPRNVRLTQQQQQSQQDKEHKRTKERTIGYIIEKVSQWRKLYNGYMDENHQLRRMSLEDAAEKVGVSKKSLDDYLSQLRQGRALGFNFNEHKDEKVGFLRQYVKENSIKNQKQGKKNSQIDYEQPTLSKKQSSKRGKR